MFWAAKWILPEDVLEWRWKPLQYRPLGVWGDYVVVTKTLHRIASAEERRAAERVGRFHATRPRSCMEATEGVRDCLPVAVRFRGVCYGVAGSTASGMAVVAPAPVSTVGIIPGPGTTMVGDDPSGVKMILSVAESAEAFVIKALRYV